MSSSITQTTLNRREIYRQTNRILTANLLHFFPISLLFFPLTFSVHAAIQFHYSSLLELIDSTTFIVSFQSFLSLKTLIIIIAFTFSFVLLTVAGIASITYTTNQAIHHKHISFSSTVKSLSNSYIPLLSTVIAGLIKLTLISLLFALIFPIAITKANKALGFPFELFIFAISSLVFLVLIVYFLVIWGSGPAIAVLELKSGFEPLRQSANQSAEFRSHSFAIVSGSSYFIWIMVLSSVFAPIFSRTTINWISIWNICFACLYSSLMVLQYVVANTVLYVHYKVACGGEIVKTAMEEEEVSGEYVEVGGNDGEDKEERFGGFSGILCGLLLLWLINFSLQTIW